MGPPERLLAESAGVVVSSERALHAARWCGVLAWLAVSVMIVSGAASGLARAAAAGSLALGMLAAHRLATRAPPAPRAPTRARMRRGALRVAPGLFVLELAGERREVPISSIRQGWVEVVGDLTTVVLRLASHEVIWARVDGPARAREVLLALGVAPEQRALDVPLVSLAASREGGLALAWAGFVLALAGLVASASLALMARPVAMGLALVCVFGLARLAARLSGRVARVGTDGVELRGLGLRRFVPYSDLALVEREGALVRLVLRPSRSPERPGDDGEGDRVELAVGRPDARDAPTLRAAATLEERIRGAREGSTAGEHSAAVALLDRAGRSPRDWLTHLRGLAQSRAAAYRDVSLGVAELAALVEDGTAPPARKLAAAIALGGREPEAKPRLRFATGAYASAELRELLWRALEGELADDEAVAALEALDRPRRAPSRERSSEGVRGESHAMLESHESYESHESVQGSTRDADEEGARSPGEPSREGPRRGAHRDGTGASG